MENNATTAQLGNSTQQVETIMPKKGKKLSGNHHAIDECSITPDTLTGRGGLTLFVRYLNAISLKFLAQLTLKTALTYR